MKLRLIDLVDKVMPESPDRHYFEGSDFLEMPIYQPDTKTCKISLVFPQVLPFYVLDVFLRKLKRDLGCKLNLYIEVADPTIDYDLIQPYLQHCSTKHPALRVFQETSAYMKHDAILYKFVSAEARDKAIQHKHILIEELKVYGIDTEIIIEELQLTESENIIKEMAPSIEAPSFEQAPTKPNYQTPYRKSTYTQGKRKNFNEFLQLAIGELVEACDSVCIQGTIFDVETNEMRNGKLRQSVWISDDEDAFTMKWMERGNHTKEVLESIKSGQYVKAYGNVSYDEYERDLVLNILHIEQLQKVERVDDAEVKRVELHAHTKMSEMDGVSDVVDYIHTANRFGMDAIAVTDHMGVQAYPKAQHAVRAINKDRDVPFRMIYGVEFNMVDPILHIVRNANDDALEDVTYCVFDLETTGLSSRFDEIIEFGGQIVKGRSIVKSFQTFIKPKSALSDFTTNLTGIKQSDVDDAPAFADVADKLLEFIGDSVLVAHNAEFDYGFLNEALEEVGKEPLMTPVVDTLDLARSLLADRKGYRLGQIARSYGVRYDEDVAHRADYDAEVLTDVFVAMLHDLQEKGITTLQELQDMQDDRAFTKVRPKHINVITKNQAGLKEIFELVTLSHTKFLSYNNKKTGGNVVAEPRIPRDEIAKRRDNGNILLGSSCVNGEIFDIAQTKSEKKLDEAVSFYDFIEIQPVGNYMFLVDRKSINSKERLMEILQSIVDSAKRMGVMVVGSGDAHYVDPVEKKIRDIFISSQAIGGVRHPLYIYNKEARQRFTSPAQHLRTTNEMLKEYEWLGKDFAYEIVVTNTRYIASMVEEVLPIHDKLYPPEMEGSDKLLSDICYENARSIYGEDLPKIVEKRLKKELDSIIGHGFYVVYYISHLLVKKSLEDGYMVGSRGSVGSSFVATMSNITEVNPLAPHYVCKSCHYHEFFEDGSVASGFDLPDKECPSCGKIMRGDGQDIPFETFLGFEGDKVPDIDLNFSGDYQPTAHAYTKEVFGEDYVFRAGTIGTVATKTAFGYVKGYEEEMGLPPMSRAKQRYLAMGCEGVKRTTGQHPGGIIVIPNTMEAHDFTPVQYPANDPKAEWMTTHFEFHDIHDNVLKFDILGHVDPTAMKLLQEMSGIDPTTIPMNDPATMSIFSKLDALQIESSSYNEKTGAVGIPEFGTQFVRGILEMTKPTTFDELVRISGLSHGTDVWLNNAKDLIAEGKSTLREVIGCRDDIMVYLMHKGLEPKLSFTIMESVRKGKGLKDDWIKVMKEHNLDSWYIDSCNKIKYMFPKAHAVAYVMMAVRIAWFKVHHPVYYYCMYFSIRCDAYDIETMMKGTDAMRQKMTDIRLMMDRKEESKKDTDIYSTLELSLEMYLRGFRFSNIDLMRSDATTFKVDPDNPKNIIPPFTSIDGLGANVAKSIVEAREGIVFLSKEDVLKRTGLSGTLLKKLDALGVLDDLQDENQMSLF